ncbi:MAG: hypothetical protein Greene101449_1163, partial [Candidatus Peregrinibacteria bacterium Greene1014_49]
MEVEEAHIGLTRAVCRDLDEHRDVPPRRVGAGRTGSGDIRGRERCVCQS